MNTAAALATKTPAPDHDFGLTRIVAEVGASLDFMDTPVEVEMPDGRKRVPARGEGPLCLTLVPSVVDLGELGPVVASLPLGGDWTPFAAGGWVRVVEGAYRGTRRTHVVKHLTLIVTISHRSSGFQISGTHPESHTQDRRGRDQPIYLLTGAISPREALPADDKAAGAEILNRLASVHAGQAVLGRMLALPVDWTGDGTKLKKQAKKLVPLCEQCWAADLKAIMKRERAAAKAWAKALGQLDWGAREAYKPQELATAVQARYFWRRKG